MAEPATIGPRSPGDTTPEGQSLRDVKRSRAGRRAVLAVFGVVLALGATGQLGVRAATTRAASAGWSLVVTYPKVTRPGHAVPFWFEVRKAGGFGDQPVTVRVTASYFALFDANAVLPAPSAETATDRHLIWEFDPPPGEVLRVVIDTRSGPNRQRGASGDVAVLDGDEPVVSVRLRTWVMP